MEKNTVTPPPPFLVVLPLAVYYQASKGNDNIEQLEHNSSFQLSIFNRIKFFETPRHLMVYDPTWEPVITAHLGSNLPDNSIPEDCTKYLKYLEEKNYTLPHHGLGDDEYE